MDRRKTILTATLINAALLCLLFVIFMQGGEEHSGQVTLEESQLPLFNREVPLSLANEPPLVMNSESPVVVPDEQLLGAVEPNRPSSQVVHQLPPQMPIAAESSAAPVASAASSPMPAFVEIKVQKGDSLDKLARTHHTTMEEILRLNQLSGNILRVGQVLKIPASQSAPIAKAKPETKGSDLSPEYYTVKVGDNPWGIAMKHHMKVEELLKLNNLNEERARRLRPGDRLRIK